MRSKQRGKMRPEAAANASKPVAAGAGGIAASGKKPAPGATSEPASRTEPIMFRVRPDLAVAIRRTAFEQGISVQSLILLALRDAGIPVLDADLEDLRKGGGRKRHAAAPLRISSSTVGQGGANLIPLAFEDALLERLASRLMPATPAPVQTVTITNCCCRNAQAAEEPVTQNPR